MVLLFAVVCATCVEPYTPEVDKYEEVVVIDGFISDAPPPYTIRISRSFHYDDPFGSPEKEATVYIWDDRGNSVRCYEESPGVYKSADMDFRGEIGRMYRLHVYTRDQQVYESDFVELKAVPGIERLYAEFEELAEAGGVQPGFQIYVDSQDPDRNTRFYRYEYEETWEFQVPYPSVFEYENHVLFDRTEDVSTCWKTESSTRIMTFSTERLDADIIKAFPITFVPTDQNKLRIKYSILVRQYAMSQEAYQFWEQLKGTNQNTGTLFDPQPMQITSNFYHIEDSEVPVIGFFEASAVSERRIFLTRGDVPQGIPVPGGFDYCKYLYLVIEMTRVNRYGDRQYCIVNRDATETVFFGYGIIREHACCDCTESGYNTRPDYWK